MKQLIFPGLLTFSFFCATAQTPASTVAEVRGGNEMGQTLMQNVAARQSLNLNGRWNYIIDPYETGYYDYRRQPFDQSASGKGGFYDDRKQKDPSELIEYDFDASPTLKVPGDWNSQDEKLLYYEGTIWYRRKFTVVPEAGKRYFLTFGAVNYESHVYLNGKKLGMHKGGFTPFQFEVTGQLMEGNNVIVVKADNTRHKEEVPTINTDWWNYGGITRDVSLVTVPATFIADYKVQLAKNDPTHIEGYVQLSGGGGAGGASTGEGGAGQGGGSSGAVAQKKEKVKSPGKINCFIKVW